MSPGKRAPLAASSGEHHFGGDWTEHKLAVLERYLAAYTKALKNSPFKTAYIDAFAGTGYRTEREEGVPNNPLLFTDLIANEPQQLLDGSVARALRVEPPFHTYIFIEKSAESAKSLRTIQEQYPGKDIRIREGDANEEIRGLCNAKNWSRHRAVLFLDPYGMQVEWDTVKAIAATRAIDMWLLFPLGIGVNRLLPRSGIIPEGWKRRIDLLLGTTDWYEQFYRKETTRTLFGEEEQIVKASSFDQLSRYFVERLKTVFAAVAEKPLVLSNSAKNPLYLLCFAAGNAKGSKIALKIAEHLLLKI
jgi:three-Cys-motif partner protein